MSVQSEAERAARGIAGLINTPVLNGYDPLTAIPRERVDMLSSGEKALLRMARAVDDLGTDLARVDEACRYEVGRALTFLGAMVTATVRQPREHTVPCRRCGERTRNVSAMCDNHTEITG